MYLCLHICEGVGSKPTLSYIMGPWNSSDEHQSLKLELTLVLQPQFPGGWGGGTLVSCHLRGAPGTELVSEEELVRVMALEQGLVP